MCGLRLGSMSSGATVYIVFPELPCCLRLCTSQGTLTRTLIGSWDLFGIISIHSPIVLQAFPKTDVHAPLIHIYVFHCANSPSDPNHNSISTHGLPSTFSCHLTPDLTWVCSCSCLVLMAHRAHTQCVT